MGPCVLPVSAPTRSFAMGMVNDADLLGRLDYFRPTFEEMKRAPRFAPVLCEGREVDSTLFRSEGTRHDSGEVEGYLRYGWRGSR